MAYNEVDFLPLWIRHYSHQFGAENCFVIDHGSDDGSTENLGAVNRVRIPRSPMDNKRRADFLSQFCSSLLSWFDSVIYTDSDEFLVADPRLYSSLAELCSRTPADVVTATGVNVVHVPADAPPLDTKAPLLAQRRWGYALAAASKPALTRRRIAWPPGFHSYDDPPVFDGLFNFHLPMADRSIALRRQAKRHTVNWAVDISPDHPHRVDLARIERYIDYFSTWTRLADTQLDEDCAALRRFQDRVRLSANGRDKHLYQIDMSIAESRLWRIPDRFLPCL